MKSLSDIRNEEIQSVKADLVALVDRLKGIIEDAYREGFQDGRADTLFEANECSDGEDACWIQSDSKHRMDRE